MVNLFLAFWGMAENSESNERKNKWNCKYFFQVPFNETGDYEIYITMRGEWELKDFNI